MPSRARFALVFFLVVAAAAAIAALRFSRVAFAAEEMTPILIEVQDAPVPFAGSDGRIHLEYEMGLRNFSSGDVIVERVEVFGDGGVGSAPIATLDSAQIATRLQPYGVREPADKLAAGVSALLFIHITLPESAKAPAKLVQRVSLRAMAAPPGHQEIVETSGVVTVDRQDAIVIGPPLRGSGYISADSCCDSTRHVRAVLPVNGRLWLAQRFAVDWEQVDASGRIYHGPRAEDASYTIWGKEAIAVADAKVASVTDGLPSQTPGAYPTNISLDEADGNSVVLDLGGGRFCLYAHLQAAKIRVHPGDAVKRGQVLGLVGNSGNSLVPHLHFHVMSTALPLAANGLPYLIDSFTVTGATPGTHAFDEAEEKGTVVPVTLFHPAVRARNAFPMDQLIVTFE